MVATSPSTSMPFAASTDLNTAVGVARGIGDRDLALPGAIAEAATTPLRRKTLGAGCSSTGSLLIPRADVVVAVEVTR